MSEQSMKLEDLLVVCVLRYGQTQDNRFALAALVAYQTLPCVHRPLALGYVEGKVREIQDRVIPTIPQLGVDGRCGTLAAFVRSMGLAEALKGDRATGFDSDKAKQSLHRIAPELAKAIDTCDLGAVYSFLKHETALRAVA
jgi:hypothetical protein